MRDATTSLQQEKDAPEWSICLRRRGQKWNFEGVLGLNKDKIDRLESKWNADGSRVKGVDADAGSLTESDHEPADASEQETSQHEDPLPPQGPGRSPPPGPLASAPQDAAHIRQ
jgi:hypothetical protein